MAAHSNAIERRRGHVHFPWKVAALGVLVTALGLASIPFFEQYFAVTATNPATEAYGDRRSFTSGNGLDMRDSTGKQLPIYEIENYRLCKLAGRGLENQNARIQIAGEELKIGTLYTLALENGRLVVVDKFDNKIFGDLRIERFHKGCDKALE